MNLRYGKNGCPPNAATPLENEPRVATTSSLVLFCSLLSIATILTLLEEIKMIRGLYSLNHDLLDSIPARMRMDRFPLEGSSPAMSPTVPEKLIIIPTLEKSLVQDQKKETLEGSWSRGAAEKVEGIECSGHGRAYLDGLVLNGHHQPLCECNSCYGGPNCSLFFSNCSANAASGDPYFLEPFWMERGASSGILVSGWHRMGYTYSDGSYISEMLVNYINKLHQLVGNAVTDGRFVVFGGGATQLLNAAVYAFSSNSSLHSPAKVVTTAPCYPVYKIQTKLFNSRNNRYEGDTSIWKNNVSRVNATFIEFVTSPNNPDGKLTNSILNGSNVKTIYDFAYYWPHFTAIPSPADQHLMIFTISKLTGHAGTRFGWAIIKDEGVYEKMLRYLDSNTIGISREAQLRALKLMDVMVEGDGKQIFKFAYSTMKIRWIRLKETLSKSKRFSLQKLSPQYCSFFKRSRDPTPAYAWLKCEREEEENCYEILKAAKIEGREGSTYSAYDRYVRLSLIGTQDDFEILIKHLTSLVAQE